MFDWIRRAIWGDDDASERREFIEMVDDLNAQSGGGRPTLVDALLGELKLPSRCLILGDPQYLPQVEVANTASATASISARLQRYPSGASTVAALTVRFGERQDSSQRRLIGQLAIDSAKVVLADKADWAEHWTDAGKDRIGVISTVKDDLLLKDLTRRFQLTTTQVNQIRAEIVGPISEQLETRILDYLKTIPRYADFPFMYFGVQTNNSFDRVNYMPTSWRFLPTGNQDEPVMFACETGRGDGMYEVFGEYCSDQVQSVSVDFIDGAE